MTCYCKCGHVQSAHADGEGSCFNCRSAISNYDIRAFLGEKIARNAKQFEGKPKECGLFLLDPEMTAVSEVLEI